MELSPARGRQDRAAISPCGVRRAGPRPHYTAPGRGRGTGRRSTCGHRTQGLKSVRRHRAHASFPTQRHPDPAPVPAQRHRTAPSRTEPNRRTPAHLPRARSRRRRRRLDRTWRRPAGRCRLAAALCNSAPCRPEGAMRRGEAAPPREPRERCSAHPDQQGALPARGLRCERWGRAGAVGCPVPSRRVSVW